MEVPFDLYCPSMQGKLSKGICPICKSYCPNVAAMLRHKKCHQKTKQIIEYEGTEIKLESEGEGCKIESEGDTKSNWRVKVNSN